MVDPYTLSPQMQAVVDRYVHDNWETVDWNGLDVAVKNMPIPASDLDWSLWVGLKPKNPNNQRDFAATLFVESDEPLENPLYEESLIAIMEQDRYDIVRLRIAIALYKRGNCDQRVVMNYHLALKHSDLAAVAERFRNL